ncbi:hypothetical protein CsSME_00019884 [Camellia sinensis var. sinensis]
MLISQVPVNRGCWVTLSANIQPTDHTSTGVEYFKPSWSSDHQTKQEFDSQLQSISPSIFLIPHSDHHCCSEGWREGGKQLVLAELAQMAAAKACVKFDTSFGISQIWHLPYSTIGVSFFNRTAIL